jgi:hypothetical protein
MIQENFATTISLPTNYINQLENTCAIAKGHTDVLDKIHWIGNKFGNNCVINNNQISYDLDNNEPTSLNLSDYDISGSYYIGYGSDGILMTPQQVYNYVHNNDFLILKPNQNNCSITQLSGTTKYPVSINFTGNSCFNCYINETGNPSDHNFKSTINANCLKNDGAVTQNRLVITSDNKGDDDNYYLTNNNGILQSIKMN